MRKWLLVLLLLSAFCLNAAAEDALPQISGTVKEIEKYGHAVLDISLADFESAGFDFGDVVTVKAKDFSREMPFLNGYYVKRGEYLVCAYPGREYISVCINYERFADKAGVGVGDRVTITMAEKAGELALQEINNLVYTNSRDDYDSDEIFANFRPVLVGEIAEGRLYRSASPADNRYGRARYANALAEEAGIHAVMNLANTSEELEELIAGEEFASGYYRDLYRAGRVITLGLPVDFASDGFLNGIARGFAFLSAQEPPYLIHCTEGKDRAGFTVMLVEALMGAGREEIISDYMKSFENYYGVRPGTEKYDLIAEANILTMLSTLEGENADLKTAAEQILIAHGMTREEIVTLRAKLGNKN